MRHRLIGCAGIAYVVAAIAGCALEGIAPAPREALAPPPGFPSPHYRAASADGKAVYRVDSAASLVVIEVRRAGSLARLGHDHVVASRGVGGYVLPDEGRADLFVPVATLTVDDAALRAEAGFDTQPSASDIAGTRSNMLGSVLDAEHYPYVLIRVQGAGTALTDVEVTLHGTTRRVAVEARVDREGDRMRVIGRAAIDQTDFGITPYSVLGGALAVRDRVDLSFSIVAVPHTRLDG